MRHLPPSLALQTALWYLAGSAFLLVLSNSAFLELAPELYKQDWVQTYKELVLIAFTVPLLYWFLSRLEKSTLLGRHSRLQEFERAHQALLDAQLIGRTGSWNLNLFTGLLWWSEGLCKLAGVRPSNYGGHFDFLAAFVPAEDFKRLDKQRERALAYDEPMRLVCRFVTPHGRTRYWDVSSRVERDDSGQPHLAGSVRDITGQQQAQSYLHASQKHIVTSHRRLLQAWESAPVGVVISVPGGKTTWVNAAAEKLLGRTKEALVGHSLRDISVATDTSHIAQDPAVFTWGDVERTVVERQLIRPDGTLLWARKSVSLARDENGAPHFFINMLEDITTAKKYEDACGIQLAASQLAATAFEFSGEALGITDAQRRYIAVNRAFELSSGFTQAEVRGNTSAMLIAEDAQNNVTSLALDRALVKDGVWTGEFLAKRKNGELYRTLLTVTAVADGAGIVTNYVVAASDLTRQKQLDERATQLARIDRLTGLPNRKALQQRIQALTKDARASGECLGLVMLGYDRFSAVTDLLGSAACDLTICEAAARLTSALDDTHYIARCGVASFAVLAPRSTSREALSALAKRCIDVLACTRASTSGVEITLTASAGLSAATPSQGENGSLINQAEAALLLQGAWERNTLRFFSTEVAAEVSRRLAVEAALLHANVKDEFTVFLQPKWRIETTRVTGAEALLRWNSKLLGPVSPAEFIPVAEQHPIILEIGRWVITEVVQALALHDIECPGLQVSVNLSARQLEDKDLPGFIAMTVADAGLLPACLQFELTETSLVQNQEAARQFLQDLRDRGFSVALDDFGVGYSSLTYFAQFPVDVVKLDRSFVEQLPDNETACVVASSVLEMAKRLHMQTVAEGVETEAQRYFLEKAGCQLAQGWLVCAALPIDEFFARLDAMQEGRDHKAQA